MASCCYNCIEWFVSFVISEDYSDKYGDEDKDEETEEDPKESNTHNDKDEPNNVLEGHDTLVRPLSVVKKQLFNRHGFNLAVFPGGIVKGVREAFNPNAVLYIITMDIGEVIIQGLESGTYIAMDSSGRIYSETNPRDDHVRFMEHAQGNYLTYLNKKYAHMGWYLGLKKTGEPKKGELTSYPWPQKAILFTHRDSYPKPLPTLQLRNKHGYFLRCEDLKVSGTKNRHDQYSIFELLPGSENGSFRLHAVEDDSFIAMNGHGKLYGDREASNPDTLFLQHSHEQFFEYLSHRWAHRGWYLAIKKNGKPKKAKKTFYPPHQNAIQFKHLNPFTSNNY